MKYLILIFFSLVISSCKNNNVKVINEDLVVLKPNILEIKKKYHKYSTFNPFDSTEFLYSPIEPSINEKGKAKILFSKYNQLNFQYFNQYIRTGLGGTYEAYIFKNNEAVYRHYVKVYKSDEKNTINSLNDIKILFSQKKINYKLFKNKNPQIENSGYVFILKDNNIKNYSLITIFPSKEQISVYFYYNVKDTIKYLSRNSIEPYLGKKIEN